VANHTVRELNRHEKLRRVKDELTQWQQFVVDHESRLDRMEIAVASLMTVVAEQDRCWYRRLWRAVFRADTFAERVNKEIDRRVEQRKKHLEDARMREAARKQSNESSSNANQ
jgi:hypothetical protein